MTKKHIITILTFTLLLLLSITTISCSLSKSAPNDTDDENPDLTVVGFSQPGAESAWRVALTDSVKESFTEDKGYKLIYKDAQSKQDNQIRDIRTFIQQGVDYIVISPIVETGWDTVFSEAKAAGIPVIICDRNVVVSNESLYTAFVGSDFKAEGESAVYLMEKLFEDSEPDSNKPLNIVHIQGTLGSSAQIGRSHALELGLGDHENWKVVYEDCGEFTKAKGREIMAMAIDELGAENIDVVYCENDEEAFGAMAALNEAGISYGPDSGIKIVSFDAVNTALIMCMNGQISAEVECNPLQGPYIYNLISHLKNGEAVPKITYVKEQYFTSESLTADFIEGRKY
ncbi:simple sugar transport system substrate-binding protein [Pseudobutyrivibrio sp. ACV-2]|uniref:ABC transporter substrate-binding protein n=1 Tax=Pseudobutyrivibrio sp. ACV-2 TaxID=1520801 RepID=UPI00089793AE|nr:ABC transporter substrate-binding protein [Pseudobutyrivibrio sp. ACV-2]SEA04656.1 simple sugar transport system substrate-binding protein [Pseudobutyrivibrio sp. ACV-2]